LPQSNSLYAKSTKEEQNLVKYCSEVPVFLSQQSTAVRHQMSY